MATEQLTKDTDNLDPQQLLRTLAAVKKGDFSVRMPIDSSGMAGKIADTLNDIIELNERLRDDACYPRAQSIQHPANHRAHRQSNAWRSREMYRRGCLRLHYKTCRYRAVALAAARLAISVKRLAIS